MRKTLAIYLGPLYVHSFRPILNALSVCMPLIPYTGIATCSIQEMMLRGPIQRLLHLPRSTGVCLNCGLARISLMLVVRLVSYHCSSLDDFRHSPPLLQSLSLPILSLCYPTP